MYIITIRIVIINVEYIKQNLLTIGSCSSVSYFFLLNNYNNSQNFKLRKGFYFFIVNEILRFPLLNIKVIDEYFSHFCTFNAIRVEVVNDMKVLLYHVPHLDECLTLFVEDFDINVILTQENVDISLELKSLSEAIIEIFHCHVKFYAQHHV